jgi:hypothetical protein
MRSKQTLRFSTSKDETSDPANVVFGYDTRFHAVRLSVRTLDVAQLLSLILQARHWVLQLTFLLTHARMHFCVIARGCCLCHCRIEEGKDVVLGTLTEQNK